METAELEFSASIRIGAGLPEVEGMVRLHRARCRMRMLLEQPQADAAAVEDLTIAIRDPAPDIRFNAYVCRSAAYCSLNEPAAMLRDVTDAHSLLAAHRPLLQPLLLDCEHHLTGRGFRKQEQRDQLLLTSYLWQEFPKLLKSTAMQLADTSGWDCKVMCKGLQAAKARLTAAKAEVGQPANAAVARAKERGGKSYR